jgi:hypothetical protein
MSDTGYVKFDKRLREIERRHRKAAAGYVRLEERDGLLVPVEKVRLRRGSLPLRGLALTLVAFMLFKGFVLANLGMISYQHRLSALAEGNWAEQLGAWIMYPDTVTLWIADQIRLFL